MAELEQDLVDEPEPKSPVDRGLHNGTENEWDGEENEDEEGYEADREQVDVTEQRPSSLRYWLRWGIPIVALALFGAFMIAPEVGLPSWEQALSLRNQTVLSLSSSSHEPPAHPGPTDLATTSPVSSADPAPQGQGGAVSTSFTEEPAVESGTESSTGAAPSAVPPADASAPQTSPADVLAGPVDDAVLQQLLTKSMPERLGASDPQLDGSPAAQATVQAAWQALSADLNAGGWSQAHMQAHELTSDDTAEQPGQLPPHTTVVIMWSAISAAGDLQDRQMSAVRMDTITTPATPQHISTL